MVLLPEPVGPVTRMIPCGNWINSWNLAYRSGSMPSLRELELHGPLVQQAQDDAFAVDHGDHRDADIDLAAADA